MVNGGRRRVAVTGLGLVTALGNDKRTCWERLVAGESGVRLIDRFSTEHLRTTIAATVDIGDAAMSAARRTRLMLNRVVAEAAAEAGAETLLPLARSFIAVPGGEATWSDRIGLRSTEDAPGRDERARRIQQDGLTEFAYVDVQARFGLRRRPVIVTTACASGATAVQLAADVIRRGDGPIALAAAADSTVSPEGLIRFSLLSALSRRNDQPAEASRPFDQARDGFVMGEGAAALILEDEDHARARGVPIIGFIRGYGDATDNFHRTRSNPTGERIRACIERALDDAGLAPSDIGSVNAHGTSTPENDKMEALGSG